MTSRSSRFLSVLINMLPGYVRNLSTGMHLLYTDRTVYMLFVAFLGINQFRQVGLRFVCWFYVGNNQRLTESGFMEKPGMTI